MKVYEVIIIDYDLYDEYGLFVSRKDAEKKMRELLDDPYFLWKNFLTIEEKELVEESTKK